MIIDTSRPENCRSCGAEVFWRQEVSKKWNPYNPPESCPSCDGVGHLVIHTLTGDEQRPCPRLPKPCNGGRIQVSHYATCPQADEWRKKKAKS